MEDFEGLDLKEIDKKISEIQSRLKELNKNLEQGRVPVNTKIGTLQYEKIPAFSVGRQRVLDEIEQLETSLSTGIKAATARAVYLRTQLGSNIKVDKLTQKYLPKESAPFTATGVPTAVSQRAATVSEEPVVDEQAPVETTPDATTIGSAGKTGAKATPAAKVDANAWIDTQLQLRNLPDTKANRTQLRSEYQTSKTTLPADWREKFAAKYPGLEYMLNENIFGPEVTAVIQRAVSERWFLYPETAQALIQRELANTPYGMNATAKQETFDKKTSADQLVAVQKRVADLQKSYGMLGLSDADWQRLGFIAERNGEDDLLTQQRLFQAIYEKTPEGNRRYENAVKMVENGKLGQEVNKEFSRYLLKAPDDAIERYATGQTTIEDIRQQSRAAAKFMFPALSELIDQGVDVKFVADQYATAAADVLELAPGTIDMSDPRYRVALDVRDGANSRTMTLGEWQTLLKTDPNYGWQYTKQANQQSMDISTTIARVFGKIQ